MKRVENQRENSRRRWREWGREGEWILCRLPNRQPLDMRLTYLVISPIYCPNRIVCTINRVVWADDRMESIDMNGALVSRLFVSRVASQFENFNGNFSLESLPNRKPCNCSTHWASLVTLSTAFRLGFFWSKKLAESSALQRSTSSE